MSIKPDPKVIHRYEVIERLGQGGMGALYLAKDPMLDRLVAIKLLRDGFDNDDLRQRFVREARSAARLTHVNIVSIFDFGEHDGRPFIAMEYIPGETLAEKIKRRTPIPLTERLRWMEELCAGLAHAHKAQIVHRDVKPANVMISPDGLLKILDFGIARLGDSRMTRAGMVVGTVNYMSPEQLAGARVDYRSDIFAVGAVFYELMAFTKAFPGGFNDGLLHRILNSPPDPLAATCPDLDPEIERIILHALEKEPSKRYNSLTAMAREIAVVRQRLPVHLPTVASPNAETVVIRPGMLLPTMDAPGQEATLIVPPADKEQKTVLEAEPELVASAAALERGDFSEALSAANAALLIEPGNPRALELIQRAKTARDTAAFETAVGEARTTLQAGQLDRAAEQLEAVVRMRPDDPAVAALRDEIGQARAEVERVRAEREREDAERRQALEDERRRVEEEQRRLAEEEKERQEEERRRREAAEAERDRELQQTLQQAGAALEAGRLDDAAAAITRARGVNPSADLKPLQARLQTLRAARQRAESEKRRREQRERLAAIAGRGRELIARRDVQVALAVVVAFVLLAVFLPRFYRGGEQAATGGQEPTAPPVSADAGQATPETLPETPPADSTSADSELAEEPAVTVPDLDRARALYGQRRRFDALKVLTGGDPQLSDAGAVALATAWLEEAQAAVAAAADKALGLGVQATTAEFAQAATRRASADRLARAGRLAEALQVYWRAEAQFAALKPAPPEPVAVTPPVEERREEPPPPPPPPKPDPGLAEHPAVLRTLSLYSEAMTKRDADAVARVRQMQPAEVREMQNLSRLGRYIYNLVPDGTPQVDGNTARVACARYEMRVERSGRQSSSTIPVMVQLEKRLNTWIITSITPR